MPKQPFTNIYDLDYFTGSQCFLYLGDVWIDEVTSLQYICSQDKRPLYGYASQLLDDTTKGHVIVQGNFTINFKEQGYLWAVLRRFKSLSVEGANISSLPIRDKQKTQDISRYDKKLTSNLRGGANNPRPVLGSNGTLIQRSTIERIVSGNVTRQERYNFYNDLAGYSTFDVDSPKDKVAEDIYEAFEDQVWTKPDDSLNSQIRRTDDNVFDDFDMYVVFGNYANKRANHTVSKIIGVRLTSQGKSIELDGNAIQEQYSFIAQSVA